MPPVVRHFSFDGIDAVETHGIDAATPWHDHARLVIGIVDRGRRRIAFRDRVVEVAAGSGFVVAPGHAHRILAGGLVDHRALSLPALPGVGGPASGRIDDAAWVERVAAAFVAVAGGRGRPDDDLVGRTVALLGPAPAPSLLPGAVRRVRRRLADLPEDRPTLDALAAATGLTPWHLQRLYRRHTGISPHDADQVIRLRLARALMLAGASPSTAAAEAGFADQSHFNRVFKRLMWLPPGRWSSQVRRRP
jgi:AraC-like DNA-binding protein